MTYFHLVQYKVTVIMITVITHTAITEDATRTRSKAAVGGRFLSGTSNLMETSSSPNCKQIIH